MDDVSVYFITDVCTDSEVTAALEITDFRTLQFVTVCRFDFVALICQSNWLVQFSKKTLTLKKMCSDDSRIALALFVFLYIFILERLCFLFFALLWKESLSTFSDERAERLGNILWNVNVSRIDISNLYIDSFINFCTHSPSQHTLHTHIFKNMMD